MANDLIQRQSDWMVCSSQLGRAGRRSKLDGPPVR
jgi:hypothetical protein